MNPASPFRDRLPRVSDRLPLGRQGLQVSPICLGMVTDPNTVLEAYDQGINFFFLSGDLHWGLYEGLRKGLSMLLARGGDIRDRIVVASVSYVTQPYFWMGPFAETLEFLPALERLDVVVAGGSYRGDYPLRQPVFQELADQGAYGARACGFSFHERAIALQSLNERALDIAYIRYNPAHPKAQEDLFPHLRPAPRPLAFGFKSTMGRIEDTQLRQLGLGDYWIPRHQDYYRYALSRANAMDGILCSPCSPAEVRDLARALEEPPLDREEEEHLEALAGLELDRRLQETTVGVAEA